MPKVNYDEVARTYDRRYQLHRYDGVERELLRFVGATSNLVLEVGCGTGHWLDVLRTTRHRAFGLDPSRRMLRYAASSVSAAALAQGTASALPFRRGAVDGIFCINAFHHFPDKQGFIHEAVRILRSGGGLMIANIDPHTGLDRSWYYEYFPSARATDLARYPSSQTIREWLADAGFQGVVTRQVQHFGEPFSARIALEQGRLDKSQTSQLVLLTDEEYEAGVARLRREIDAAAHQGRDLMILGDQRLYATSGWAAR